MLLTETRSGNPTDQDDLREWVSLYGVTHPVLADPNWEVSYRFATSASISLPSMHQLAAGAEVLQVETRIDAAEIEAALPE